MSPTGAGTDCTASQPCSLPTALTLFTPQRFAIKLFPGTYRGAIFVGNNQRLEIHGDGADLTRGETGPIVEVKGLASLMVLGLRIHHSLGHGIFCTEDLGNMPTVTLYRAHIDSNRYYGIIATLGCRLQVARSRISRNVHGGIFTNYGDFVIVNNVFFYNGSYEGTGAVLVSLPTTTHRLEFNTFAFNYAADGYGKAIDCAADTYTARNNIIRGNDSGTSLEQVRGCTYEYTLAYPGPVLPGIGNSSADPLFENVGQSDFHLMAGSPARGAADPGADLSGLAALDIDGDQRTSPADLGTDEVP